jgi:hypothetical protein
MGVVAPGIFLGDTCLVQLVMGSLSPPVVHFALSFYRNDMWQTPQVLSNQLL